MAAIDDAIQSYEDSLENATAQFIADTQELRDEGLSDDEILAIIAALSFTDYFVENLGFNASISSYIDTTRLLLADLPFFGLASEAQLVALENIQRFNITSLSRSVATSMRASMAQGIVNNLDRFGVEELIKTNIKANVPRIDNIITTQLSNFQQSVIATMASELPDNTKYRYIGPRDDKNRPVCRKYLNAGPLTKKQIQVIKSDGFLVRGGVNCRHLFLPENV